MRRHRSARSRSAMLAAAVCLALPYATQAGAPISDWLNPNSGYWSDPNNWSNGLVPGVDPNAPAAATITTGSAILDVQVTLSALTLDSPLGQLNLDAPIVFTDQADFVWGSGLLTGPDTAIGNSTMSINFVGAALGAAYNPVILAAGAATAGSAGGEQVITDVAFNNHGTFTKLGAGTTTFAGAFSQDLSATTSAAAGTLRLETPWNQGFNGTFAADAGATIEFAGPASSFNGVTFAGAGVNRLVGPDPATLPPGLTPSFSVTNATVTGNLELAAGTLFANTPLFVQPGGSFTWSAGAAFVGQLSIDQNGSAVIRASNVTDPSSPYPPPAVANFGGTVTFDAPAADQTLALQLFTNSGTIVKTGAATTTVNTFNFDGGHPTAGISAAAGTLRFDGTGNAAVSGTVAADAGAAVEFDLPTVFTYTTFTGAGVTRLAVSPNAPASYVPAFQLNNVALTGNLELAGGSLATNGTAVLVQDGASFTWSGGTFAGALLVSANGTVNLRTPVPPATAAPLPYTAAITNNGTVTLGSSDADEHVTLQYFQNNATLIKTGPGTTTLDAANYYSTPTTVVSAAAGTLRFAGPGSFSIAGTVSAAAGATIEFASPGFPPSFVSYSFDATTFAGAGLTRLAPTPGQTAPSYNAFNAIVTGNLELADGQFSGDLAVQDGGSFTWSGGTYTSGLLYIAPHGSARIVSSAASRSFPGFASVNNSGTLCFDAPDDDQTVSLSNLQSFGTVLKTGAAATTVTGAYSSTPTSLTHATAGTLRFAGAVAGSPGGTFLADSGAAIEFTVPNASFAFNSTFAGAGVTRFAATDPYANYSLSSATVSGNLELDSGQLSGDLHVLAGGAFSFLGGTFNGTLSISPGATANLHTPPTSPQGLNGLGIDNSGTINTGSAGDEALAFFSILNSGTILKSGAGHTTLGGSYYSASPASLVSAAAGTLTLLGNLSLSGTVAPAAGAVIELIPTSGGNFSQLTLAGAGLTRITVPSGSYFAPGGFDTKITGNLELAAAGGALPSGGTLSATFTLQPGASFTWSGATFFGALSIPAGASADFHPPTPSHTYSGSLAVTNAGALTFGASGGDEYVAVSSLYNTGSITKIGAGTTTLNGPISTAGNPFSFPPASGTVTVSAGRLLLTGFSTSTFGGAIAIAPAASLEVNASTTSYAQLPTTFSGGGQLRFTGGSSSLAAVTLATPATIDQSTTSSTTLSLSRSTVAAGGSLTVNNGTLQLSGSGSFPGLTVASGTAVTLAGGAIGTMPGSPAAAILLNPGSSFTWSGGNLEANSSGNAIQVQPGAIFQIVGASLDQNDLNQPAINNAGTLSLKGADTAQAVTLGAVNNTGLLIKAGAAHTTLAAGLASTGTVSVADGTLTLTAASTSIPISLSGALNVATGTTFELNTNNYGSTATLSNLTIAGAGTARLLSGAYAVPAATTLTVAAGTTFSIPATINGNDPVLTAPGSITFASGSTLDWAHSATFAGNLTIASGAAATVSVPTIALGSSTPTTITNRGSLTFAAPYSSSPLFQGFGPPNGLLLNSGTLTQSTPGSATLGPLDLTSSGTLSLPNSAAALTITGNTTLTGGTLDLRGLLTTANLTITGPVAVTGNVPLRVTGALSITGAAASLDLDTHSLDLDYPFGTPSPITQVRSLLAAAAGPRMLWNGATGITSSAAHALAYHQVLGPQTAVGYGEASTYFAFGNSTQPFYGPLDNSSVLLIYTYAGDATLDHVVNDADVNALVAHWHSQNAIWTDGDFTYNGIVDNRDLDLLSATYGQNSPNFQITPAGYARLLSLTTSVPEPTAALMAPAAACLIAARRRRRRP